jgi:hypothetical protein
VYLCFQYLTVLKAIPAHWATAFAVSPRLIASMHLIRKSKEYGAGIMTSSQYEIPLFQQIMTILSLLIKGKLSKGWQ